MTVLRLVVDAVQLWYTLYVSFVEAGLLTGLYHFSRPVPGVREGEKDLVKLLTHIAHYATCWVPTQLPSRGAQSFHQVVCGSC